MDKEKNKKFPNEDRHLLLSVLNEEKGITLHWITRKEVAAWSTVVIYLGGSWYIFQTVFKIENPMDIWNKLYIFIPFFFFSGIVFALIHSQYASIHFALAHNLALRKLSYLVATLRTIDLQEFSITPPSDCPDIIISERKAFSGNEDFAPTYNPAKLFLYFLILDWTKSKKRGRRKKRKLSNNYLVQEAATYCLIVFTVIGFFIYLFGSTIYLFFVKL